MKNYLIKKKIGGALFFILTTIIAYFIWGILDAFKLKTTIIDTLLFVLPKKILRLAIPDILFLLIISGVLLILWNQHKKFKGLSPERFKELLADNHRIKEHNTQLIETFNNSIKKNEKISEDYSMLKTHYPHLFQNPSDPPLEFKDNVYWRGTGDTDTEGPFCPKCCDESCKQIHMIKALDSNYYKCPACDLRVARPSGRMGA